MDVLGVRWEELCERTTIKDLVQKQEPEGKVLEYKLKLPQASADDKLEFLADTSSFANAAGGYIFYGIEEQTDAAGKHTGKPKAAHGLDNVSADEEIRRLEQILRGGGIQPRIPGIQMLAIEGFPQGPVIAIRIPRSWVAPHMVTRDHWSCFYTRNSAGKYQMDVNEIRQAFALSEELPRRVKTFRDERLGRIVADEGPIPLGSGPKVVLHIIPVSAARSYSQLDMPAVADRAIQMGLDHSHMARFNFDGYVLHGCPSSKLVVYTQIFRSGAVEDVDTEILQRGSGVIPGTELERALMSKVDTYKGFLEGCAVEPPLFVLLALLGVRGFRMGLSRRHRFPQDSIERDVLILPEIFVEGFAEEAGKVLRPAFDILWQATGYERSPNYDGAGRWNAN